MDIVYIDRKTGKKKREIVAGDRVLQWVYGTAQGDMTLEMLIKRKFFSWIYGKFQDMPLSRRKIKKFIKELDIDTGELENADLSYYKNFNDFFVRKLKRETRPICSMEGSLISPGDGRILAYEDINVKKLLQVKGHEYTMEELIKDKNLALDYNGGASIILRLNPSDYHRFHFPDNGIPETGQKIKGSYYSVNPIALRKKARIYCQNKREITIFRSENFGQVLMVEVGATCVGSIVQTYIPGERVEKGAEKGYFKFGGSTIIMFIKPSFVKIDRDIIENTNKAYETKVGMGERIGILQQY